MTALADLPEHFAAILYDNAEPYSFYQQARNFLPIFWSAQVSSWVVTRHSDVKRVLEDADSFQPLPFGPGSSAIHGRVILHMEGREHTFHGGLMGKWIRSRRRLTGDLREMAQRITDTIVAQLPVGEPVDLHQLVNTEMPLVMTATFMGIPEVAAFRPWYDAIGQASVSNIKNDPQVQQRGVQARQALGQWLEPILERKRRNPENDLLSDLCTAEYEGALLSDQAIASACSLLLAAGVETTSRALSNLQKSLLAGGLWEALGQNPDLVVPACAETLRFNAPAQGLVRQAKTQVDIAGVSIAPQDKMFALVGSANRDEEIFPAGEKFIIDRFAQDAFRQFTPKADILPFGAGSHHCTGSLLAQMEMEVVMLALLNRFPRVEFAGEVPEDVGYVLRAPAQIPVILHPRS